MPAWDDSRVTDADESVVISHNWDELRRFMWDYVGIVRTNKRLERAAHRIAMLQGEIQEFYAHFHVTRDLLELRNLVQVADLIVKSAQLRREKPGSALQPRLPGSGSACCAHHSGATGAALRPQPGPLGRSPKKGRALKGIRGADRLRRRPPCLPQRRGTAGLARLAQKALPCCPAPPCSPLPRSSSSSGMTVGG